jgi:hypothetical protein
MALCGHLLFYLYVFPGMSIYLIWLSSCFDRLLI